MLLTTCVGLISEMSQEPEEQQMLNQGDVVSKTNFKLLFIFIKTSPYRAWLRNILLELSLELLSGASSGALELSQAPFGAPSGALELSLSSLLAPS